MHTVTIETARPYQIHIAKGLLAETGTYLHKTLPRAEKVMLVGDDITMSLFAHRVQTSLTAAGLTCATFTFPHGEEQKNLTTYTSLLAALAENGITRTDCMAALGGGVVGDLTGFAAATWLRGIPVVQLPTTVLASVDSSVGGKTAVDIPTGKNLVGAFHQPSLVLCDPDTFATLSPAIFADGMAEVIKYGFLSDKPLLTMLTNACPETLQQDGMEEILTACVRDKGYFVKADERDTGVRQLLNLGHTLGHGIEAASHFAISHGSAVAIGMHMVTKGAVYRGICPMETLEVLDSLLTKYHLPTKCPYDSETLYHAALSDKKRAGGKLTMVLPTETGKSELFPMDIADVLPFIEDCLR